MLYAATSRHVAVAIAETKGHMVWTLIRLQQPFPVQLGELKRRGAGALLLTDQARLCDETKR